MDTPNDLHCPPPHFIEHFALVATKTKNDLVHALYRPIPKVALQLIKGNGIGIYCLPEPEAEPKLFLRMKQALSGEQLADLQIREDFTLLVRKQDFSNISEQLLNKISPILEDPTISLGVRFALLQIAYAEEIERHYCKPQLDRFVVLAQKLGREISSLLQQEEISIFQTAQLRTS